MLKQILKVCALFQLQNALLIQLFHIDLSRSWIKHRVAILHGAAEAA